MHKDIDVKITKVEPILLSSPYGKGDSLGQPLGVKSIGLIKIHTDLNIYGLGESYSAVYMPEIFSAIVKQLEPYLVGRAVGSLDLIVDIENIPFVGRDGIIKSVSSAIDIALWDLRGKILGVPTQSLLVNNPRNSVPVYASSGTAIFTPSEIMSDVHEILNAGFNAYKMRIGYQAWSKDLKRVQAARDSLGSNDLMIDAIMGTLRPTWSKTDAIKFANELSIFQPRWLEEPLHPNDILDLSEVRSCTNVDIAAGEAYSGIIDFEFLLRNKAVDVLQFDATHSGGIEYCVSLAKKAHSLELKTAVHVWGSAVALASNASLALSCECDILEYPMVSLEVSNHMWVDQPLISEGYLYVSDVPGLGVDLTIATLDKYPYIAGSGYRLSESKS